MLSWVEHEKGFITLGADQSWHGALWIDKELKRFQTDSKDRLACADVQMQSFRKSCASAQTEKLF